MSAAKCTCCGRALPVARKGTAPRRLSAAERSALAVADPDAYRAAMAALGPLEDLEFHCRLFPGDAAAAELATELAGRKATAADRAAIVRIKAATAPHPGMWPAQRAEVAA